MFAVSLDVASYSYRLHLIKLCISIALHYHCIALHWLSCKSSFINRDANSIFSALFIAILRERAQTFMCPQKCATFFFWKWRVVKGCLELFRKFIRLVWYYLKGFPFRDNNNIDCDGQLANLRYPPIVVHSGSFLVFLGKRSPSIYLNWETLFRLIGLLILAVQDKICHRCVWN